MDNTQRISQVQIGSMVEISLAWCGCIGKVVGTFAVELVELPRRATANTVKVRVAKFRSCWYKSHDDQGNIVVQSALMTNLAKLPESLATEVHDLLGSERMLNLAVVRNGLVQYIFRPGGHQTAS